MPHVYGPPRSESNVGLEYASILAQMFASYVSQGKLLIFPNTQFAHEMDMVESYSLLLRF